MSRLRIVFWLFCLNHFSHWDGSTSMRNAYAQFYHILSVCGRMKEKGAVTENYCSQGRNCIMSDIGNSNRIAREYLDSLWIETRYMDSDNPILTSNCTGQRRPRPS